MPRDEIVLIIDKSGSMQSIKQDAIGGFNTFLDKQKAIDRKANVTFALFDHTYELIHNGKDINEVDNLTEDTYSPSGMTALLDAVGRTIDSVGKRLDAKEEAKKPENVIVFILTDGQENSSSDYSRDRIKEMIEHQQSKYSWEFIYGGANQDAFAEAGGMGIRAQNTFNYSSTGEGTRNAFMESSDLIASMRLKGDRRKGN